MSLAEESAILMFDELSFTKSIGFRTLMLIWKQWNAAVLDYQVPWFAKQVCRQGRQT